MKTKDGHAFCSFCGKHHNFVEMLLASPEKTNSHICGECVDACLEVIQEKRAEKEKEQS